MKKLVVIIGLLSCVYACKPGIPKEIMQPDQMRKVLFDVHVVDGYVSTLPNRDTARVIAGVYLKGVYKKYGIDSALYEKSMNYYYTRPDLLKKIYDALEKEIETERKKESVREDKRREKKKKELEKIENLDSEPVPQPVPVEVSVDSLNQR